MVTVQGSVQISMRNDVHGLSKSGHVIEDEWSGCYLTSQYKPVCGCFGGTVNPVPVMTRVWVTKQHLYSYITLPCRVLFFNLIMIRPCEEVGHFSILSALLVRAGGLNCSVGIQGGSMENLKGKKNSTFFFLSSKWKNWIWFSGGGLLLTNFRALFSSIWMDIYIYIHIYIIWRGELYNWDYYLIHSISFSFTLFLPKYK